ncbi:MAG: polyprenyl synthetase family protein [Candidatus Polarisedimenticolia bacterium]
MQGGAARDHAQARERVRAEVERRLDGLLPAGESAGDGEAPARLVEAMRYALLGGGKRLRPLLVIASGEAAARSRPPSSSVAARLCTAACAVEMIHTFSLIHDDLPALDDDDLRRGRPSLHVQFDEATAILAGDALLNLAYETLSEMAAPAAVRQRAVATLARGVGLRGMIAGQVIDLQMEGRAVDGDTLHRLHRLKTGALFTASCELGGIVAGAAPASLARLRRFGEAFGLAFQVVDDVLDVEGSAAELGKSPGKDARAGKATFPALWGVAESRRRAAALVDEACAALRPFGARAGALLDLARGMLARRG